MIGCLIGEVFALEAPTVLLNVNGVGYEIDTPLSTFCQLQKARKLRYGRIWSSVKMLSSFMVLVILKRKQFSAPY